MSLMDDPFADMVKYDGACQICHGDMRKCDGKCGGMLMEPTYIMTEVSDTLTQEQFQEVIDYIQSQGYIIPGVIFDSANRTHIIIQRKPTAEELASVTAPSEADDAE